MEKLKFQNIIEGRKSQEKAIVDAAEDYVNFDNHATMINVKAGQHNVKIPEKLNNFGSSLELGFAMMSDDYEG